RGAPRGLDAQARAGGGNHLAGDRRLVRAGATPRRGGGQAARCRRRWLPAALRTHGPPRRDLRGPPGAPPDALLAGTAGQPDYLHRVAGRRTTTRATEGRRGMTHRPVDATSFAREYFAELKAVMDRVDLSQVAVFIAELERAYREDRQIFIVG